MRKRPNAARSRTGGPWSILGEEKYATDPQVAPRGQERPGDRSHGGLRESTVGRVRRKMTAEADGDQAA